MRRWKQLLGGCDATEIAEAALVLPLLFTLLLGIFWLGRAYNVYAAMNHAAREGARAAAGAQCATCGNTYYTADQIAQQFVSPVLSVSRIDTTRVTSVNPPPNVTACPGASLACTQSGVAPTITVCRNVDVGLSTYNPPVCGSSVYFQYLFSLPLPYAPPTISTINLSGTATARMEQ
jgi:Flp pilus assembly protein TadG